MQQQKTRLINLIKTSLAKDKLAYEEELERIINDNLPTEEKDVKIKDILNELVLIDLKVEKWEFYTKPLEQDIIDMLTDENGEFNIDSLTGLTGNNTITTK